MRTLTISIRQRLQNSPSLHEAASNTGWLFVDRMLRIGVGLFVGIWIARYLGPSQYGVYSYALAFVGLFGAIAALGLDNVVVRDIVQDPHAKYEVLGTSFVLKLLGAVLAVSIIVVLIHLLRPENALTQWIVILVALGMVFQAFDTIDFWFQSQVRSKYTVYARSSAFVLISIVRIVLLEVHAPLIAFAAAALAEVALSAIGLVLVYRLTGEYMKLWRIRLSRAKQLLGVSWPLIISGVAILIYMKIDQIMLGEISGDAEVGIYAAAARVSELWYFIPISIVASVFPAIVAAKKVSEKKYYSRIQQLFALMTGLSLLIAVPVTLFSNVIIMLLYGDSYAGAGPILAIHIWSAWFVFLGVAQLPWDTTEGLTKLALRRTLLGAFINVTLNWMLLPAYGGIGAAVATLVAYAVSACFANGLDARTRPILVLQIRSVRFMRYLRRPAWDT